MSKTRSRKIRTLQHLVGKSVRVFGVSDGNLLASGILECETGDSGNRYSVGGTQIPCRAVRNSSYDAAAGRGLIFVKAGYAIPGGRR